MGGRSKIVVVLLLLCVLAVGCKAKDAAAPAQTKDAKDFTLQTTDGESVTLSELKGKIVVLNFWATWCPPCKEELPEFQLLWDELSGSSEAVLLMLDVDDSVKTVQEFLADNGYSFGVLMDVDAKVAGMYEVYGIPTTIVLDTNGEIFKRHEGETTQKNVLGWIDEAGK